MVYISMWLSWSEACAKLLINSLQFLWEVPQRLRSPYFYQSFGLFQKFYMPYFRLPAPCEARGYPLVFMVPRELALLYTGCTFLTEFNISSTIITLSRNSCGACFDQPQNIQVPSLYVLPPFFYISYLVYPKSTLANVNQICGNI